MVGKNDYVDRLERLCQLDIDAANAYDKAIEELDDDNIRKRFITYREDHERHVEQLRNVINQHGGSTPERKPDFKGYVLSGFTSIASKTGTKGALKAMESNEKLTNKEYQEATQESFPSDVKAIIDENYADEKRHLQYIEEMLNELAPA